MRVKDEKPYIKRALESLTPLGGEIIFLDDRSTDGTTEIAKSFPNVHYFRNDDLPLDEGRDRTFTLRRALELEPEWIFSLDGDEELTPRCAEQMNRAALHAPEEITGLEPLFVCMWGEDEFIQAARFIWPQPRAFRVSALKDRSWTYHSVFRRNFHCGAIPKTLTPHNVVKLNGFIKYWGYETEKAAAKKQAFYEEFDPIFSGPQARDLNKRRKEIGKVKWHDDLDAREIGIMDTVTF